MEKTIQTNELSTYPVKNGSGRNLAVRLLLWRLQPRGIPPMEKINLHAIYEFSAKVKPLSDWNGETVLRELMIPANMARAALAALIDKREPVNLRTARGQAMLLRNELGAIWETYFTGPDGKFKWPEDLEVKVPSWTVNGIASAARDFEAVFRAEMEGMPAYIAAKKGNYDTSDLVDAFDVAFPDLLRPVIGEKALLEYRAAGRCYAFGLATAGGFHACRAVEAVLHNYCIAFTGKPQDFKTWGQFEAALKDVEDPPMPNERTLGHLKLMRENDRNPIMHPRIDLSDADADALLGLAKATMIFMAQEMAKLEGAGKQLKLVEGSHESIGLLSGGSGSKASA